jgi:ferredoxin-type protein NapG
VQCIRLDPTAAHGVPYIDADLAACAVCESLACMPACPSGALVPTPLFQIRMGTAVWRETSCIRTHGEECRACVERCPMGTAAIDVVDNRIEINPDGCVGCGMCQQVCPTGPKSIQVIPVAARYQ